MLLSQLTCGKCNVTYFSFSGLNRGSRILYLARLERALSCCLLLRHLLFHHLHHSLQSRFWLPVLLDSQESFARLWTLQSRVLSPSCIIQPVFSIMFPPQVLPGSKAISGHTNSSSSGTQWNLFLVCSEYFPALRMVSSSSSFYCTLLQ